MQDRIGGEERFYRASKLDWFITGLILCLAIISFIWVARTRFGQLSQPKIALIYLKDNLLEKMSLDKDKITEILGGKMRVEVKNNRIRVLNSDCPQQICLHMGWIKYGGQTIVCVPNKVLIEIKSIEPQVIDAVSY